MSKHSERADLLCESCKRYVDKLTTHLGKEVCDLCLAEAMSQHDKPQQKLASPAVVAAENILELTSDRIISTVDISHLHCEVSVHCTPEIVDFINKALAEERQVSSDALCVALETLRQHDQMAFILLEKLRRGQLSINDRNFIENQWAYEAAKRYEEEEG